MSDKSILDSGSFRFGLYIERIDILLKACDCTFVIEVDFNKYLRTFLDFSLVIQLLEQLYLLYSEDHAKTLYLSACCCMAYCHGTDH